MFSSVNRWNSDLGYIFRVHGQEINSFRRKTRSKALHMWEWDVRVLDFRRGSKATTRRSVWVAAALRPRNFGAIADMSDLSRAFIVPMVCFGFIAFYGFM
jgi:hypothetical protein